MKVRTKSKKEVDYDTLKRKKSEKEKAKFLRNKRKEVRNESLIQKNQ